MMTNLVILATWLATNIGPRYVELWDNGKYYVPAEQFGLTNNLIVTNVVREYSIGYVHGGTNVQLGVMTEDKRWQP